MFRQWGGDVGTSVGAYVIVNDEGWIITAAHLLGLMDKAACDQPQVASLRAQIDAVQANPALEPRRKTRETDRLKRLADRQWITNHVYVWGEGHARLVDIAIAPRHDLAVGRLAPFDPSSVPSYPVFKNPSADLAPGTGLCRLGFPFADLKATYDESADRFDLVDPLLTYFPNEGIFTRTRIESDGAGPDTMWIETSSPGLRGQSGGPIVDMTGTVWGIQSKTTHLPLGFNPSVTTGARTTVEHQFMSLGIGSHPAEVHKALNDRGISFQSSAP
jgi:hypothetical protein